MHPLLRFTFTGSKQVYGRWVLLVDGQGSVAGWARADEGNFT